MEVTGSIWLIVRELHRAGQLQRRAAAGSALGPVAIGLLNLAAQAPVRPSAAAAELDVVAQSVTRAVAELVGAGLARRVGDDADGRSYVIELTDEGRAARERFQVDLVARFTHHLDGWSAAAIETFAGQLSRLVSSLAEDVPGAPAGQRARRPWRTP